MESSTSTTMDFKSVVYNAARDGKLQRLKIYLDHRDDIEKETIVNAKTAGATPLIMACKNGHLDAARYLIESCKAEIELAGSVTFDGETIDGAPPLWCAAAAGHLQIVKLLVGHGSDVNKTTYTNSTPLRAACFDGHYDVVRYLIQNDADIEIANRHGHTCLMISCYKGHNKIVKYLLELKANVDRKSAKGNTALHDCAESGSLEILKLLIEHNAVMTKDSYGMTPLLAASVSGHMNIVEYLISRAQCTLEEKVDALELLGATYVDKKRDMVGALKYWKRALNERDDASNAKNKLVKRAPRDSIAAYEKVKEFTTNADLHAAMADSDNMRMQALLVRERILGPAHPDTSYYIRYRGAVYADMGNFDRCIALWMYALDMQQKSLEPLNPMTQSSFLSFAELFSFIMTHNAAANFGGVATLSFRDLMVVLEKAADELDKGVRHLAKLSSTTTTSEKDMNNFNRLLVIIMHIVALLCKMNDAMTDDELFAFKKLMYHVVNLNPKGVKENSLLHLACSGDTSKVGRYPVCNFPCAAVIALLIEVGADVNQANVDANTPLHAAAVNQPCDTDILAVLLKSGAHLDTCNLDHKTPMQLMRNATIYDVASPLNYINLQCLAASVIVRHSIPYQGHVTHKLEQFIRMH
ncbi:protein fem-1 homolog C-like [Tubulanus polymorphus]|uniref:protein fem-1 homolog C-like n=1 Tax=Tubulanus polymorphus TaxID=672921 RepID=UPI003DA3AA94